MRKGKKLAGQIKKIIFPSQKNGYTVLQLNVKQELVTVVGRILPPPKVGDTLFLSGEWQKHPKHGKQFEISRCEKVISSTESSEAILSLNEHQDVRELKRLFQSCGISGGYADRVSEQYGDGFLLKLEENPYRLVIDISGIDFLTSDKIASKIGFPHDSTLRIRAGVLHIMSELVVDGHVYVPLEELTERASKILDLSKEFVKIGIEESRLAKEIFMEYFKNAEGEESCAVYLPDLRDAEYHSAKKLKELVSSPYNSQYINTDTVIPWVQEELGIEFAEQQVEALKTAVNSKVMVLTGAPGTGKTTLIRAILKIREARGFRVMLAASTGRAAKSMEEATGHEAKTIHRMLEYVRADGESWEFMRDESNPLECDLLIVDEASMIDQILFHHLLKAVPNRSALIFVGDANQLPSVGAGNVLKDIIDSSICPIVRLSKNFRQAQESNIVINAHKINAGEMPEFDRNYETGLKGFYFIEQEDPEEVFKLIKTLVTDEIPECFNLDPLEDIQVLTPRHRGDIGTIRLNSELQVSLNKTGGSKIQHSGRFFQEGDKVMQDKNNYDKDVYNGDIGTIHRVNEKDQKLVVKMDNGLVSYDFHELDELIHAYAITIHKSQGLEYSAVVIPVHTQHSNMLQRNLLYTAVTRGKKLVIIVGTKKELAIAVKNDNTNKRWTRLSSRLSPQQQ